MAVPIFGGLFGFGQSAIKKINKDNPDAIVFIVFAVLFVVGLDLTNNVWALVVSLLILVAAYCWRRTQADKMKLRMAQQKLDGELARVREIKNAHRPVGEPIQQTLPLERRGRRIVDK